VREYLEVIHQEWGFYGAINMQGIYYDSSTQKVTLTDWGRSRLPFNTLPSDYPSGFLWPYDRLFKISNEDNYHVMDELAIFCCFYNYTKLQAEDVGNQVLETYKSKQLKLLVAPLKQFMCKCYHKKTLVGLRPKVKQALDLVLEGDVTAEAV